MATWRCPQQWSEWVEWLGAGLHGRCRWRLPILLSGILFATGRRTVASWLRAAGIRSEFSDYYYFIAAVGRKAKPLATQLLLLLLRHLPSGDHLLFALDDTPTKRYGPKVQGAGIQLSVAQLDSVTVQAFAGTVNVRFGRPVPSGAPQ